MADIPSGPTAPARRESDDLLAEHALPADWGGLAGLGAILIFAALLRFWGLHFGLPYFEHPDEWAVADEALRMLRTGDFSPFSFTYPTLYIYLQVGVAAAYRWWSGTVDLDLAGFYSWARTLTALLGVGTVGLTYAIGRRIAGRPAGLAAALFLAVLPTAVGDSHYVTVDTPAAFFALLAFLLSMRLAGVGELQRPRQAIARLALIAGIAVGLAASTKYNAGVMIVPLALAAVYAAADSSTRADMPTRLRRLIWLALVAGSGVMLGFTIGTPRWLFELPRLLADLASIAEHYRVTGHPGAESSRPALFYWNALQYEASLVAWVGLAGALLALFRHSRPDLLILALVAPYVLQLSSVRVVFFRNAVPLLPFVCLLAALALIWMAGWLQHRTQNIGHRRPGDGETRRPGDTAVSPSPRLPISPSLVSRLALAIAIAILVAQPLSKALRDEWLRAQPTTRILATEWVLAHAPDGTRVWLEDQTLILPARLRVQGGQPVTSHPPDWYREQGFRFLIVNASIPKNDPALIEAFGEPVAQFAADGQRYGHTFLIFDTGLNQADDAQRTPSGATLGGGALTLEGYRHPAAVAPGEVLPIALYWQVNRVVEIDYVVFVHLVDSQGAKIAQRDVEPLDGSRPTSGWRPGELIRDDQDLTIPSSAPPGRYRLVVGMYDPITLISINESGPIDIGEVEIR